MSHPSTELETLIRDGRWTQFQFYSWFPHEVKPEDRAPLMIAGDITEIRPTPERQIACHGTRELRANGGFWEDVTDGEPFTVPSGDGITLSHFVTGLGRLVIISRHPQETVIAVLFPEDDLGTPEKLEVFGELSKLDLTSLTIVPRQEAPELRQPTLHHAGLDTEDIPSF